MRFPNGGCIGIFCITWVRAS
uniref:Uncharacterized protein n=1 Tax=Lepeophtheirus salmonis TaxID=72036 RepID=A0A0K2USV5_LEPSM